MIWKPMCSSRAVTVLVLFGAVLAAGCGEGEKQRYAAPDSLCGVTVSARLLDPLLPPGDSLRTELDDTLPDHGIIDCNVLVDGKVVLIANQTWRDKNHSALSLATLQPEMEPEDLEGSDDFQYSPKGAAKRVDCPRPAKPEEDLFAITRIPGPQKPDLRAVKAFTENYSKAVAASPQCSR
ncbi:hypothetical protein ACIGW3_19960 [Streptomyces sp. NPDC053499]|uniref:hypothetical protein n=1 Tax=Streptomyces sp. NPDC053499 TaxID=3365707 RepID=UPI0037D83EFC